MKEWKEIVIGTLTDDKIIAMIALTTLGLLTIWKYPVHDSLAILTAIVGGIAGFVTGTRSN